MCSIITIFFSVCLFHCFPEECLQFGCHQWIPWPKKPKSRTKNLVPIYHTSWDIIICNIRQSSWTPFCFSTTPMIARFGTLLQSNKHILDYISCKFHTCRQICTIISLTPPTMLLSRPASLTSTRHGLMPTSTWEYFITFGCWFHGVI